MPCHRLSILLTKKRKRIVSRYHIIHTRLYLKSIIQGRESDQPLVNFEYVERKKAAWSDLLFGSSLRLLKSPVIRRLGEKALSKPSMAEKMDKAGIMEALDCSKSLSVIRKQ